MNSLVKVAIVAAMSATALGSVGATESYPDRPITLIVPLTPGGAADIAGRLVAEHLQQRLGQPVVVENRPGAGTTIGVDAVARAEPDGYTLGLINVASHSIAPGLYGADLAYDPISDFEPISMVMTSPNILVVNPNRIPATTFADFITYAQENPGTLTYGSAGVGTSLHIGVEMLGLMTGTSFTHVPYGGSSEMMADLVGGHIDFSLDGAATAWPQVEADSLVALAVATPERVFFAPDLPTLNETTDGLEILAWHGVAAPAGTDPEIVSRLSTEIQEILKMPEVRDNLQERRVVPVGNTAEEFAEFIAVDVERWTPAVEAALAAEE